MIKKPLLIGLTGGIGAGKSTVAQMFEELGVPIIDADQIAHQITEPGTEIYKKIVSHFGDEIVYIDKLNRRKLREVIFKDPQQKQWLENLLHPVIIKIMQEEILKITSPYIILVIPLLTEAKKLLHFLDRILVVDTAPETQLERTTIRDQSSDKKIQFIIKSQAHRQERLKIADDVIQNDADLAALKEKVLKLHQFYLSESE